MNTYIELVKAYPIYSAMLQFALLGTLGDIISKWMQRGKIFLPYKLTILVLKMIEWAVIAVKGNRNTMILVKICKIKKVIQ